MAQEQLRRESVTDHPDRLWIWEKFVYLDENQRTWLPLVIKKEDKLQVFFRQEVTLLGKPMTPTQIGPSLLPLMWQLYPDGRYRSSDSGFWRIVYHVKASVFLPGIYGAILGFPSSVPGLSGLSSLHPSAKSIKKWGKCTTVDF
uniref:TCL1 family AKT coactivator A n=1 Tax=Callithrix jacchus TaxID=9483 RepID=A0A8I3W6U5_CALJA